MDIFLHLFQIPILLRLPFSSCYADAILNRLAHSTELGRDFTLAFIYVSFNLIFLVMLNIAA